eukprot:gene5541-2421_t
MVQARLSPTAARCRPVTEQNDVIECADGSVSTPGDWAFCGSRGNRAKCPPNKPVMCADPNECGGGT